MTISRIAVLFISPFFFLASIAAECTNCEIVVQDTYGTTRAVAESTEPTNIEFNLVDDQTGSPANGTEVVLKNTQTGETLRAVAANGTAVFDGVEPGVWQVAANGVTFTDVGIGTATAFVGAAGAGAAAAGGGFAGLSATGTAIAGTAVVGAGAVAVAASDDSSSDKPPLSPSD